MTGRPADGMWCTCAARRPHHAQSRLVPHWSLSFSFLLSLSLSLLFSLSPSISCRFFPLSRARTLSSSLSAEERFIPRARALSLARARSLSHTHTSSISLSHLSRSRSAEEFSIRLSLRCLHSILHSAHTRSLSSSLSPLFSRSLTLSLSCARFLSRQHACAFVCVGKLTNIHSLPPSPFSLFVRMFSSLACSLSLALARSLSLFLFFFSLSCALSLSHTHTHTHTHTQTQASTHRRVRLCSRIWKTAGQTTTTAMAAPTPTPTTTAPASIKTEPHCHMRHAPTFEVC